MKFDPTVYAQDFDQFALSELRCAIISTLICLPAGKAPCRAGLSDRESYPFVDWTLAAILAGSDHSPWARSTKRNGVYKRGAPVSEAGEHVRFIGRLHLSLSANSSGRHRLPMLARIVGDPVAW